MSKWIYHEYVSLFSQYLGYLCSLLLVLASAAALSAVREGVQNRWGVLISFSLSIACAIIGIVIVLNTYSSLYQIALKLSQCALINDELSCDFNILDTPDPASIVLSSLLSLFFLVVGYCLIIERKKIENVSN
ncbi:MAG: hypothetical protein K2X50_01830 [Gammaproteobacteria bacterium]|nr:hypothetical protein [Gammaproteobacteria bacterium]